MKADAPRLLWVVLCRAVSGSVFAYDVQMTRDEARECARWENRTDAAYAQANGRRYRHFWVQRYEVSR